MPARRKIEDPTKLTREEAVQHARTIANAQILDEQRPDRDNRMRNLLNSWGFTGWNPAPTKKERAAEQARKLIAEAGLTAADLGIEAPAPAKKATARKAGGQVPTPVADA